ncbi:hypothetical protein WRSd3_04082 [Shigella dysenteriae WRSd3]|uniref:Uncharacterized protein n=3 Tax=root TaxID=1 RepID=A0A090NC13_SHIDY|nr:hypothetical protein Asd1617_05212 [Shigella dysenteriae 1617]ESU76999.1 hypothetical protein WRSd3_04082 [Shigella dysenteriae WRSd3]ESU84388.1 hypothetical protein WRSd5_00815 [Shigella dysenteriae WRSd5]
MNYEEGNNIYTEIEFFFTHYFLFKKQQVLLKLLKQS